MPASPAETATLTVNDALIERLADLTVVQTPPKKKNMVPADFFAMQSAQSTFLARKTKTMKLSKKQNFLIEDLISHAPASTKPVTKQTESVDHEVNAVAVEEDEDSEGFVDEDSEERDVDDFLLVRGAVTKKKSKHADHPFVKKTIEKMTVPVLPRKKEKIEFTSYSATGAGYECGASEWQDLHSYSDGRASVIARVGAPMTGFLLTPESSPEGFRSSREESPESSSASPKADEEIPDTLVDFILEYTRMAITPKPASQPAQAQPAASPFFVPPQPVPAAHAVAVPAAPLTPPAEANNLFGQYTPFEVLEQALIALGMSPAALSYVEPANRPAKAKLREYIGQAKIEKSMILLLECIQDCTDMLESQGVKSEIDNFEVLFHRDSCGYTLLHRAMMGSPRELAQTYVVVEQMLKQPRSFYAFGLPWDTKNDHGESPLWWAVGTMKPLVVDYLLELGADPNASTTRDREDTVLHDAARRGMTAIVKSLINDPRCNIEAKNKPGDTPLFTAVFYNNAIQQKTQLRMDNVEAAEALLQGGADPTHVDFAGNNIFHISASFCDTPMLELFAKHIPDEVSTRLANAKNNEGARPLDYLMHHEGEIDDARYRRCFFALLTCNAKVEGREEGPSGVSSGKANGKA